MSTTTPNLGLFKYNPTTDTNLPFNIVTALNNNWDILDSNSGSRNIGEIVTSTVPLTDAGLHLLDGSLIQGGGAYSAFVTYIIGLKTNYPDLFTTEANWQEANTNYGVCGKFVHDTTNNTIRLPKITGIIEGTTDVSALGDLVEAGLPNIIGNIGRVGNTQGISVVSGTNGAFVVSVGGGGAYGGGGGRGNNEECTIVFDANRSSSIYGNSTTVQPQTIKAFYYIVIATSTKTSIQVDIDEIATDLNGKCDKADLQECSVIVESYVNGTSWYRVYSDGWCEQGGTVWISTLGTTISFIQPYILNNYQLVFSVNDSSGDPSIVAIAWRTKNVDSFIIDAGFNGTFYSTYIDWQASGYIS